MWPSKGLWGCQGAAAHCSRSLADPLLWIYTSSVHTHKHIACQSWGHLNKTAVTLGELEKYSKCAGGAVCPHLCLLEGLVWTYLINYIEESLWWHRWRVLLTQDKLLFEWHCLQRPKGKTDNKQRLVQRGREIDCVGWTIMRRRRPAAGLSTTSCTRRPDWR